MFIKGDFSALNDKDDEQIIDADVDINSFSDSKSQENHKK